MLITRRCPKAQPLSLAKDRHTSVILNILNTVYCDIKPHFRGSCSSVYTLHTYVVVPHSDALRFLCGLNAVSRVVIKECVAVLDRAVLDSAPTSAVALIQVVHAGLRTAIVRPYLSSSLLFCIAVNPDVPVFFTKPQTCRMIRVELVVRSRIQWCSVFARHPLHAQHDLQQVGGFTYH